MREVVDRESSALCERVVRDRPSSCEISTRQTAYCRGNSGSIVCSTRKSFNNAEILSIFKILCEMSGGAFSVQNISRRKNYLSIRNINNCFLIASMNRE